MDIFLARSHFAFFFVCGDAPVRIHLQRDWNWKGIERLQPCRLCTCFALVVVAFERGPVPELALGRATLHVGNATRGFLLDSEADSKGGLFEASCT